MNANLEIAKTKIENGAKFNGTVYSKYNGKNWVTFSIYLDGQYFKISEVSKSVMVETKKEIENSLCTNNAVQNGWLVDGKKVYNNLGYAEMFAKYGTDFE
jgi:hypothetical protein